MIIQFSVSHKTRLLNQNVRRPKIQSSSTTLLTYPYKEKLKDNEKSWVYIVSPQSELIGEGIF